MTNLGRLFLAAAALLSATGYSPAQQIELKPRWIPGKKYSQSVNMQQETKMDMGGQTMTQKMSTTTDGTVTVTAHQDPKKKRLVQKFVRMVMDMDMAGQKMHFDSSNPDAGNDPMGASKALSAMVGKELKLVMDENGKIVEFENLDELTKPLAEGNPMAAGIMKGMLSKDAISQSFDQSSLKGLPGKPVKPGDSWPYSVTMNLPQFGSISLKGTYTFKGMADKGGAKCAELTEQGALTMDFDAAGAGKGADTNGLGAALQQLGMKIDGGTIKGTTWFDPTLGAVREAQFAQTMTIKMNNPMDPSKVMELPMQQNITVKLTSVEDVK